MKATIACGGITICCGNSVDPADFRTLRYAVHHDQTSGGGFVFINNHLRRRKLAYHPDVTLTLDTGHGTVSTPPVNIRDHDIRILPYNLPLEDGCVLTASNATPLCRIGSRWFFYTDDAPSIGLQEKKQRSSR